jgi:hypothetical protein
MKFNTCRHSFNIKAYFFAFAIVGVAVVSSCSHSEDQDLPSHAKATSIIQVNVNDQLYSFKAVPDAVSFTTAATNLNLPYLRQYLISSTSTSLAANFTLSFHVDSIGSGKYVMDSSQLSIGSKTYTSAAAKSTDKITITQLDAANKAYNGTFNFYAFNKTTATDSILVTGIYSIQQ